MKNFNISISYSIGLEEGDEGWGDFKKVVIHVFPFSPGTYSSKTYFVGGTFSRFETNFIKHQPYLISSLIRSIY